MARAKTRKGKHTAATIRRSSQDQTELRKRLVDVWENDIQREKLETQGFEFKRLTKSDSLRGVLDSRTGPDDALLEYDVGSYRLVRRIVTQGATVEEIADDGNPLPESDELVLVTRSMSVLEKGDTKVYSEVLVLERTK